MHNDEIKELALANGFKLKEQPDGSMDLNPYVYQFARALMLESAWRVLGSPESLESYAREFAEDTDQKVIDAELGEIVLRLTHSAEDLIAALEGGSEEYYEPDDAEEHF